MLKLTISTFLLLCSVLNAKCIDSCTTKKYYNAIHKAEKEILENDFKSATQHYKKAFKYLKYPFSNDLLVASICMLKSKENNISQLKLWSKIYQYQTNQSIENKIKEFDLYKRTSYHGKLSNEDWTIISKDTTIHSVYRKKLSNQLDDIWKKDQGIRRAMEEKFGLEKYWVPEGRKQIIYVDSLNLVTVDSIIETEEFSQYTVGDENLGVMMLVLLHNSQWQTDKVYAVANKLKQKVIAGNIYNRTFSRTFDRFCDNATEENPKINCARSQFYGENSYWIYNNYHTYINFGDENLKKINSNREEIFLVSIEERIKQLGYQINKENLFFIRSTMWSELSDEKLKKIQHFISKGDLILIKE